MKSLVFNKRIILLFAFVAVILALLLSISDEAKLKHNFCIVSPEDAQYLLQGLQRIEIEPYDHTFGTLLLEGVAAPFTFENGLYYIPQSVSFEDIIGTIQWSNPYAKAYLVRHDDEMRKAIRENAIYTLYIVTNDSFFERYLVFTGLPILNIITDTSLDVVYGNDDSEGGIIQIFDPASADSNGIHVLQSGVSISERGGRTIHHSKKQYNLDFLSKNQDSICISCLGLGKSERYSISAQLYEFSRIGDAVSREIWNQLCDENASRKNVHDLKTPEIQFCELIYNGVYQGVYGIMEPTPQMDNSLQNDISLFKVKWFENKYLDENLKKYGADAIYTQLLIRQYSGNRNDLLDAKRYLQVQEPSDPEELSCLVSLSDLNNLIDYYLYLNLLCCTDNSACNYFLYRGPGSTAFKHIPWDIDQSFGMLIGDSGFYEPGHRFKTIKMHGMLNLMENDPDIWFSLSARWFELREKVFTLQNIEAVIRKHRTILYESGAYDRESEVWGDSVDPEHYLEMIDFMRDRLHFLDGVFSANDPGLLLSSLL